MSGYLSERVQMDIALLDVGGFSGSTAGLVSKKFDIGGYGKITVLCGAYGMATGAALAGSTFSVLVGMATEGPSSFTALSGATLVLGSSVASIINDCDEVKIWVHNSITTGRTIVIDGVTWKCDAAAGATLADYQLGATLGSAFAKCIASALAAGMMPNVTYAGTTDVATGSTGYAIVVKPKDRGAGFVPKGIDVQVTVNATATGFEIRPQKAFGVIEFEAADVLATNSSYTHFSISVASSVTAANYITAIVLREPCYPTTYAKRTQF